MESAQSTVGWNWGTYKFGASNFVFNANNKKAFEIPYGDVANSNITLKNELTIEFHQDDTSKDSGNADVLCEIRFFVPNNNQSEQQEQPEAQSEVKDDAEEETSAAERMYHEIVKRANIGAFAGEAIATFSNLPMITPRGKYSLYMYQTFLRFHGPSFGYKILYRNINKAFLLPKPDGVHMVYVVALETPLRQGQTFYPFIVVQFSKEAKETVKINLSTEQLQTYAGQLEPEMEGTIYDLISILFKVLIKIHIIVPANFKSSKGSKAIKCSIRASEGYLYPLSKSFLFINKPVIYLKLEDILYTEFARVNDSSASSIRSFDLNITTRKNETFQFTGIEKQEYKSIVEYLQEKKILIRNVSSETAKSVTSLMNKLDEGEEEKMSNKRAARRAAPLEDINMLPEDYDEEEDEDYEEGADEEEDGDVEDDSEDDDFDEETQPKSMKMEDGKEKKSKK